MNKLMQFYNGPALRIARVLTYPTRTLTSSVNLIQKTTLYSRLTQVANPKDSIVPILDQWVQEGRSVDQEDLHKIIRVLREFKRFNHALQISAWMSDKNYLDSSDKDVSIRLDLISKVYGLKEAEHYFDKIPNASRSWQIYSALLICYADAKSLEKAEATMQKMRELGYTKPLSYNVMLDLYSKIKKHEKLDLLIQEMEEKGIPFNKFTYAIRLNAYAASAKIEQMEKLLTEMEGDPGFTMWWNYYAVASSGYLKAGATEKALATLKKSEHLIKVKEGRSAYEVLLTLYASLGKKDEVYRIWNLRKGIGKFYNTSYLCMMSSLAKLDDLDGVEKIFEEWEAEKTYFDYRLPNLLITVYCKKGLLEKAESILNRLGASGKEPNASSWSRMALGYFKKEQMDKAVETMKKAILASRPGWTPNFATLASCLEYLEGKGDEDTAKEIKRLLQEKSHFSLDNLITISRRKQDVN